MAELELAICLLALEVLLEAAWAGAKCGPVALR